MKNNIKKIQKYLKDNNLKELSPNEINFLAWGMEIKNLTSKEVIYLSDNS